MYSDILRIRSQYVIGIYLDGVKLCLSDAREQILDTRI